MRFAISSLLVLLLCPQLMLANPCTLPNLTELSPPINQIKNPNFNGDAIPQDWALVNGDYENLTIVTETNGFNQLVFKPSEQQSVKLTQSLVLKPKTLYTASVCVNGKPNVPPTLMIEGGVQREKTQSYIEPGVGDNVWTLYRFTFYTDSGNVRYSLFGYQNKLGIWQNFRYPQVVEGD